MTDIQTKKHKGVILMRGAMMDLCIPAFSGTVFSLFFPPEIYAEMEIKNVESATKLMSDFVKSNKIPPAEFILIMQDPLFRKEFPLAPQEKLEASINTYLDYIPFDSVLSKRIKTDSGVMIFAANGDLIQTIRKIVTSVASSVEFTATLEGLSILPQGGLSLLTQHAAEQILNSHSLLKDESFSLTPQRSVDSFEVQEEEETAPKSILPIIIPIFLILLAVLVFVYFKYR